MRAVFVFALLALAFSAVSAEETCLDLANKLQVGGGESGEEGHTHRARAFAIGADVLSSPLSFWSRGLGLGGDRLHVRYPERIGHTLAYQTSWPHWQVGAGEAPTGRLCQFAAASFSGQSKHA